MTKQPTVALAYPIPVTVANGPFLLQQAQAALPVPGLPVTVSIPATPLPGACELVLMVSVVGENPSAIAVSTVTGYGLTWTRQIEIPGSGGAGGNDFWTVAIWTAYLAAPASSGITVTFSNNVYCGLVQLLAYGDVPVGAGNSAGTSNSSTSSTAQPNVPLTPSATGRVVGAWLQDGNQGGGEYGQVAGPAPGQSIISSALFGLRVRPIGDRNVDFAHWSQQINNAVTVAGGAVAQEGTLTVPAFTWVGAVYEVPQGAIAVSIPPMIWPVIRADCVWTGSVSVNGIPAGALVTWQAFDASNSTTVPIAIWYDGQPSGPIQLRGQLQVSGALRTGSANIPDGTVLTATFVGVQTDGRNLPVQLWPSPTPTPPAM